MTTIQTQALGAIRDQIDSLSQVGATQELAALAHTLHADLATLSIQVEGLQAMVNHQRHQDQGVWRLVGRCSMAFELLASARKLSDVHEVAAQLLSEIKKVSEP